MIYAFKGFIPVVHETAFVHPQAAVTGNVIIGRNVYIGPGAAIRGDWGGIIIKDGCNVQENCTIHMFPGTTVVLEENAHIGKDCMVGMNAVIMDNVVLGDGSIVGALSFVKADEQFASRSLIVGNPAKKIKDVTDEMLDWKTTGTQLYQALPKEMQEQWEPCQPLREIPSNQPAQESLYQTWNELKAAAKKD
jgi:phenylacetic acid degradation protein